MDLASLSRPVSETSSDSTFGSLEGSKRRRASSPRQGTLSSTRNGHRRCAHPLQESVPRLQARGELREMHSREEGGDVVLQGVRVLWYEIEWCPDQVGRPLVARSRLEADLHSLRARGVPIFDPARRYRHQLHPASLHRVVRFTH